MADISKKQRTLKTLRVPAELHQEVRDRQMTMSHLVREALDDYVSGREKVELKSPGDLFQTTYQVDPELFAKAVDLAKADGRTLSDVLITLITRKVRQSD